MCLKSVGKDSVDMLINHVVPRIETLSYNITDMITNLVNDTRNEMIPTIENLTYTFLIVITALPFLFFCGLIMIAIIPLKRTNTSIENK